MEVEFWPPDSEKSEITEFIENLEPALQKKVIRDLEIIHKYDLSNIIKMQIIKPLTGIPLYEIVIKSVRILASIKKNVCWLLKPFFKKSNHTPKQLLKVALDRSKHLPS